MECRDVRPLIEPFLSEQLLVETTQGIVVHQERCPACRAEVEGLRRLRAAVRTSFTGAAALGPDPAFLAALGSRLQAGAAPGPARAVRSPRRTWLAVAASLLLMVGAAAGWRQRSIAGLSALLEAAVGDHRFCALEFKLTEAPITLTEAARRFDVAAGALAAIAPVPTPLSGGAVEVLERHSCVYRGQRFTHLVLRYKGTPVSLLVAADAADLGTRFWRVGPPADGTAMGLAVADGWHVAAFRGARHVVFVVSSLGQDDVQDVARAASGPVARAMDGA